MSPNISHKSLSQGEGTRAYLKVTMLVEELSCGLGGAGGAGGY